MREESKEKFWVDRVAPFTPRERDIILASIGEAGNLFEGERCEHRLAGGKGAPVFRNPA